MTTLVIKIIFKMNLINISWWLRKS